MSRYKDPETREYLPADQDFSTVRIGVNHKKVLKHIARNHGNTTLCTALNRIIEEKARQLGLGIELNEHSQSKKSA
jgi:hypothetical protein